MGAIGDTLIMNTQRQPEYDYTEQEYWQIDDDSNLKHEFWCGQIYAMAGASTDHNRISLSIGSALKVQLRGRPCEPLVGDQRLKIASAEIQTFPDVMVVCPPLQYDANQSDTLLDAVVLVEVLSRSTRFNDCNAKFSAYKQLASLRHYLLIEQTQRKVAHHFLEGQIWHSETLTDAAGIARLTAIDCQLSLDEIYEDVELN